MYMHVTYMWWVLSMAWIVNCIINVPSALPYMEAWPNTLEIFKKWLFYIPPTHHVSLVPLPSLIVQILTPKPLIFYSV